MQSPVDTVAPTADEVRVRLSASKIVVVVVSMAWLLVITSEGSSPVQLADATAHVAHARSEAIC